MEQCIQLLSTSLLRSRADDVREFERLSLEVNKELGWHYLLDLPWAAGLMAPLIPGRVLDAGAGIGLMQWWMAERGATVISVDKERHRGLTPEMWERFRVRGLRLGDRLDLYWRPYPPSANPLRWLVRGARAALWRRRIVGRLARPGHGRVVFYNADVARLDDVADASVDAVVSISALEHNAPERLPQCLAELVRVLKPGGPLVATISAARDADWYHEPSSGWCYTEQSIRKLFGLADCPSNFDRYDEMLGELRGCDELRRNLGELYFRSGNNGMPWGVWDPRYVPVGIVKVKTAGGAGQPGKP